MSFRDFPMKSNTIFPDQRELSVSINPHPREVRSVFAGVIEQYLRDYAKSFDLYPYIRFNTVVTRLLNPKDGRRWRLESRSSSRNTEESFDFVCVANGHYADPWVPLIPGLK